MDFVHLNIICQFRVPRAIITNTATNLNSNLMKEVCKQFKIVHHNSTPYRPKANGAVEAANKNIKKFSEGWFKALDNGMRNCLLHF